MVHHIQLRPLRKFAVKGAPADAHQLGGAGAITTRFHERFAEQALFVFFNRK